MLEKAFPIDFVRQVLEQTLFEEHCKNPKKYFGGESQVNIFSFYEQLDKDEEVDRYVEIYRDLVDQQNRTGLIMNGTIIAPENPTITNIHQSLIIPMSFTCSFRVKLENRDSAISTINNLIKKLKGRKQDIAMFENGKLLKVGTIANAVDGIPTTSAGDFIGKKASALTINESIEQNIKPDLYTKDIYFQESSSIYYYMEDVANNKMLVIKKISGSWQAITDEKEYPDIVFPQANQSFEKFKLSMSFDSIRCDEPHNLNADEYCVITFGGSATLVSANVLLGNELTKLAISKYMIVADTNISLGDNKCWLEPLELPSGANADTQVNKLLANKFVTNTHTDSLTLSIQYTFILDKNISLLNQLFRYARYGKQGTEANSYADGITPNMIYKVREIWSAWGEVTVEEYNAKIISSVDIENTESDTLTITVPLQVQGENN